MAAAQPTSGATEGVVVQVEKDDLVLDLGSLRGAAADDVAEIWRPLRVKHPISGKLVVDRFLIGRLRLVQVRPNLSLAKPDGKLARDAESGDVVVLAHFEAPRPSSPTAVASSGFDQAPAGDGGAPSSSAPAVADEARILSELFNALHGADVPTRVRVYEGYVAAHPHGRYVDVLSEEAMSLRNFLVAAESRPPSDETNEQPTAEFRAFRRVVAGEPLRVALALRGKAMGAVLHARKEGDDSYSSQPMTKIGTEYWAATIPGTTVQSPRLQWFVEAVGPDGTRPVAGDASEPEVAAVEDVHPKAPRALLGQAQIWTDYASFNTKGNNDYVWQTEGVMGARLDDQGIRALRTGFGVYRGVGGTLQQLDVLNQPPNSVGLTYGYLEGEFGLTPTLSIAARAIIGLRDDGVGGGASAFVRIGSDLETNLLLGGEVLGGIGLRGITQFEWNSFKRFPIVVRSEVMNQPAGEGSDVGVRLIGQVGYRVLRNLVVAGRLSYQGRTINHAGPGAGAAVGYTW